MNKELAEEIIRLQIEMQRLFYKKMDIIKQLGLNSWDETQTEAMKFLLNITDQQKVVCES